MPAVLSWTGAAASHGFCVFMQRLVKSRAEAFRNVNNNLTWLAYFQSASPVWFQSAGGMCLPSTPKGLISNSNKAKQTLYPTLNKPLGILKHNSVIFGIFFSFAQISKKHMRNSVCLALAHNYVQKSCWELLLFSLGQVFPCYWYKSQTLCPANPHTNMCACQHFPKQATYGTHGKLLTCCHFIYKGSKCFH